MQGYFTDETVTGDKSLEKKIRIQINQWAAGYHIDEFRYLGNKIDLKTIIYKPAYPTFLRTQFEEREKYKGHEPYTSQALPPRKYHNLDAVQIWNIELPFPSGFTEQKKSFIVDGSQHVLDCFKCSGKGWITCPECHGDGHVTCPRCSGSGTEKCSSCGGSGSIRVSKSCPTCNGRGSWRTNESKYDSQLGQSVSYEVVHHCSTCNGSGNTSVNETCRTCRGKGKVTCSRCGGKGEVVCKTCSGTGRITCPECKGYKKLYHYYAISQQLTVPVYSNILLNSNFRSDFLEFYENWKDYDGMTIFEHSSDGLMVNPVPDDHDLTGLVQDLIKTSDDDQSDPKKILFQELTIKRIDAWEISYSWNGKKYKMLFYGNELNIVPGKSPVYDYCNELIADSRSAFNKGSYTKAARIIDRAKKINPYELKTTIDDIRQQIYDVIRYSYHAGALAGSIFFGLIAFFTVFSYCSDYNHMLGYMSFLNRPGNWFHDYHPWAQALLALVPVFFGYFASVTTGEALGRRIPGNILRFCWGLAASVFFIGLFLAVWWVINVTGITFLATLVLWLIIKAIVICLAIVFLIWKLISWIWNLIF